MFCRAVSLFWFFACLFVFKTEKTNLLGRFHLKKKKKNKLQNVETGLQDTLSENENVFISVTSLFA